MKIIIDSKDNIAKLVAQKYVDTINNKPNAVLGLATGSTPEPLYKELIKLNDDDVVSFEKVSTFNLDEYVGLESEHTQSYRFFMDSKLFNHINIDSSHTHVPNGLDTANDSLLAYDRSITESGGIDLQLLGIGVNGHIAFNEPGTPFGSLTHVVELTPKTREVNSRFFGDLDEVPTHAICMGIRTIMNAKEIVLIATGENKADAIRKTVYGDVTTKCPSSVLQLHPNVTLYVDSCAASKL